VVWLRKPQYNGFLDYQKGSRYHELPPGGKSLVKWTGMVNWLKKIKPPDGFRGIFIYLTYT
jgi:hypothetical protein